MVGRADFDDTELRLLAVDLTRAGAQAGARAEVAVRKTALDVEGNAKTIVAVDTGNLKNSIGTDIVGGRTSMTVEAIIGPTAAYGRFLEYGTSRMGPRAFMGPSIDRYAPAFEQAMGQIAEEAL